MIYELLRRFAYHPPKTEQVKAEHQAIRTHCSVVAEAFDEILPDGREKSLAITKLEEAMMWGNAAIARNQEAS